MPQFIMTYLGGDKPSTPEDGQKHFAKYQQWLSSLGDSVVSAMNPLKDTRTINPDGSVTDKSTTTMSGYTIIEADTMDVALTKAKACPFLEINGTLEISEIVQMNK